MYVQQDPASSVPLGPKIYYLYLRFTFKEGKITLNTIIWDLKMLTIIDREPEKAGPLYVHKYRSSTPLVPLPKRADKGAWS